MKNNELLQELYQCFSGKVETYIRSRVETPQDVEDMVSQVFLKVCQNICFQMIHFQEITNKK